ncbi:MAG: VacJ family lipoprotein [Legionellales bacterium]|nr:VacJ family lipoprotein [Legionellales bacterium]
MKSRLPTKLTITGLLMLLQSCGNINKGSDADIDPYKEYNKKMFVINQEIDKDVTRPIAKAYEEVMPDIFEKRITNFFDNLYNITTISNDILQGEMLLAASDSWRFLLNSTFGIAGLFDVATINDFPKHNQYFGITLAKWGFVDSPYIVLPIFGSSTMYDAISIPVDNIALSAWPYIKPTYLKTSLLVLDSTNKRASILPYDKAVEEAFDPYIFVRNAYLQKRKKLIDESIYYKNNEEYLNTND